MGLIHSDKLNVYIYIKYIYMCVYSYGESRFESVRTKWPRSRRIQQTVALTNAIFDEIGFQSGFRMKLVGHFAKNLEKGTNGGVVRV